MVWYLFILFHWFILVPMQHQTKYHLGDNVSLSWTAPDQLIHDQSWNPGTRSGRRILEASPCHGLLGPGGCLKCIPSRWMLVIICWFWYSPLMLASHLKWTWCAGVPPIFFAPQPAGFVEVGIHYPDRAKTPAKGQHAGVAAANGKEFYFLGPLSKVHYLLSQPQQSHFFCSDASATATEALHCKLWNLQPSPTPRSQPRFDWFLDPLWSSEASWTLATRSSGPWSWHQLRGPCWLCSTSGGRAGRCWMITYWSLCRDWVWWLHVTTGYRSLQSFGSTNHTCMNDACRMLAIRSIRLLNPLSVVLLAFSFMFS